jgi:hypothetical protein
VRVSAAEQPVVVIETPILEQSALLRVVQGLEWRREFADCCTICSHARNIA